MTHFKIVAKITQRLNPIRWLYATSCRPLTLGEADMARSVFGSTLDTSDIKLCEHLLVLKGYAISPNGNVYFHRGGLPSDFSKQSLALRSWFIHELTHVWQIQQGLSVVRRALIDRRYSYALKAGKSFFRYGIEQQAQMVQDYYEARERGQDCAALGMCIPFIDSAA